MMTNITINEPAFIANILERIPNYNDGAITLSQLYGSDEESVKNYVRGIVKL